MLEAVYCDCVDSGQHRAALFIVMQTLEAKLGALLFLFRVAGTETCVQL